MVRFYPALVVVVLLSGLFACATKAPVEGTIFWPKPPVEPRLVFEGRLTSEESLKQPTATSRLKALATGDNNQTERIMTKPYGIGAAEGLIAVSDTRLGLVHVFDVPRRRMFQMGWRGDGKLIQPLGIAVDAQRNIYVADGGTNVIQVYNMLGHYKRRIGNAKMFSRLTDVAVSASGDRIYALDRGGVDSDLHQVTVFSIEGETLFRFGGRGSENGKFNHPIQIDVGPDGEVYVLDAGNFRVQVFTRLGQYLRTWGRPGKFFGNLARPRGLAVDSHGHVYVSDSAYQNVQIFNTEGQLLLPLGERGDKDIPGRWPLPAGIAIDETDRLYVVDQYFKKVEVLRLLTEAERRQFSSSN
jgi:DNA-binding beta-propeller fold protein YncE